MKCGKKKMMRWALPGVLMIASLLIIEACQKDGDLQPAPLVTEARIKVISPRVDARFAISLDGSNIEDSLVAGIEINRMVPKLDAGQHFVVKEVLTNTVLIDTTFELAKPSCSISLLEYDTTAGVKPLMFIGSGQSNIDEDSARLAFYLGDTNIPAPIDIYLYKSNAYLNTLDTVPVHIFRDVKNFSATNFLTIDMSSDSVTYNILVKHAGTDELVPDIRNNAGVAPDNGRSGIITNICIRHGDPNGRPSNIHNIVRLRKLGNYYRANCMLYFE